MKKLNIAIGLFFLLGITVTSSCIKKSFHGMTNYVAKKEKKCVKKRCIPHMHKIKEIHMAKELTESR